MSVIIKKFDELSTDELFDIFYNRVSVFVVEQNCPYQEVDQIDKEAFHVVLKEDGEFLSYLRMFFADEEGSILQIGRVLTVKRGKGYGDVIMKSALDFAKKNLKVSKIILDAQSYAVKFYEKHGFYVTSDEFLEDNIPHVSMELCLD